MKYCHRQKRCGCTPASDCTSHFKGLAGVGVAYKLVCAIEGCGCDELLDEYADLVAIGTIADVMPLYDENRVFVKAGINLIQNAPRMGVAALAGRRRE